MDRPSSGAPPQNRGSRTLAQIIVFALVAAALAGAEALPAGAKSQRGYGGLGATVKAFYAQNPHGSGLPPLGVAYYRVKATKHGRVTAYQVEINARPEFSARERVSMGGGIGLPPDARETKLNNTYCIVWRSRRLGKLIGMKYAASTTTRWDKTSAVVRAERKPHC